MAAMPGSANSGPSVFLGVYCIFVKRGSFLTTFGTRGVTAQRKHFRDCYDVYNTTGDCYTAIIDSLRSL